MQSLDDYLAALASAAPAPGGGSAAMVVGAAGCSLAAMVARVCLASSKYEPVHPAAQRLADASDSLRERMLELRIRDERAFDGVVAARGKPEAMQVALQAAAAVPLEGAQAALAVLQLSREALELKNANLISDVGCAAEFANAALAACAYNVRINHKFMKDAAAVNEQSERLAATERDAAEIFLAVRAAVLAGLH